MQDWLEGIAKRALLVLDDVENKRSEGEIGNRDLAPSDKLLCRSLLLRQLCLTDCQEVAQDSVFDLLHLLRPIHFFGKEVDRSTLRENFIIGFNYHVNDTGLLPIS